MGFLAIDDGNFLLGIKIQWLKLYSKGSQV